jgi:RNA polymerase sigma-70 factor (ECF subfamily)
MAPAPAGAPLSNDDTQLAGRIARRDQSAFELLMRRHNPALFRVARAILRDDAEAEDALQDAYLDAYRHIDDFRGSSKLGTWLTRIVVNHALMRLRRQKREHVVVPFDRPEKERSDRMADVPDSNAEPVPATLLRAELRQLIERRIDELPLAFRTVFVMREIDEMTADETATCLGIPAATVRTRLFRARALLREKLARDVDLAATGLFGFEGLRCDRIVAAVLARLAADDAGSPAGA